MLRDLSVNAVIMKGQYYSQPTFNDAPMVQFTKSNAFVFQLTKYLPWTTNTFSTAIPSKVSLNLSTSDSKRYFLETSLPPKM